MPKTRELTIDLRSKIVTKLKAGISAPEIAKLYKISRRNVYYLIKKIDTAGTLKNKKRSCRKPVDQRECRHLLGVVASNPSASPVKIAQHQKI